MSEGNFNKHYLVTIKRVLGSYLEPDCFPSNVENHLELKQVEGRDAEMRSQLHDPQCHLFLSSFFPKQETSCVLKVLDWKASSSVFSLADHHLLEDQSVQASSTSSGGTLSPRQQEASYSGRWARCHSSRSQSPCDRLGDWPGGDKIWRIVARRRVLSPPKSFYLGRYLVNYQKSDRRKG